METAPLKSFATWARTALIREVTARIAVVLAPASPERVEQPAAVEALQKAVTAAGGGDKGKGAVADRVAYTWFNRIIALRFMDANGYTGVGVVSPQSGIESGQAEILAEAKRGNIDAAVVGTKTRETVTALLNGTRRSDDAQGEAYALLLADHCRYWNRAMPFMFEREGDFTELLIPANLLADDSVPSRAVKVLTIDACQDVEVIGWLYQFYISERKDEVFAGFKKNKKAGADEIPAATQLFTPHWIVRYLVENSLGRLWMLNRPSSRLVDQMLYYIAPVDEETDYLKVSSPEELKIVDPACGSGHMLTYAFDLLYAIYEEEGYAPAEIPGLILTNNLYGVEIDPRAGALAAFALTMKARAKQRTFFTNQVEPKVCVLDAICFAQDEIEFLLTGGGDRQAESVFWNQFEHADTAGSLIRPDRELSRRLGRHLATLDDADDLLRADVLFRANRVVFQAESLSGRYHIIVTNPPYMGGKNMCGMVNEWLKVEYPVSSSDLYAAFIERAIEMAAVGGLIAMITMHSWMFLSTSKQLRHRILSTTSTEVLAHLGTRAFDSVTGEIVSTVAFVIANNSQPAREGLYIRLTTLGAAEAKMNALARVVRSGPDDACYLRSAEMFLPLPGSRLIYWLGADARNVLAHSDPVESVAPAIQGMITGSNSRFLRLWHEVPFDRIELNGESGWGSAKRWAPYNKGGEPRRWYGAQSHVVNWSNRGDDFVRNRSTNSQFYFREYLSWSYRSSDEFAPRYYPAGFLWDVAGSGVFPARRETLLTLLGLLGSTTGTYLMKCLNPTSTFQVENVLEMPMIAELEDLVYAADLQKKVERAIDISRADWDRNETSWNFKKSPIIGNLGGLSTQIDSSFRCRKEECVELAQIESEIDSFFEGHYFLGDSNPADGARQRPVTLTGNYFDESGGRGEGGIGEFRSDSVGDLISYSVGCMFGRYSLDEPGLILADHGATVQDYLAKVPSPAFAPDNDNVIPIVDGDWFEDDIVARFRMFLRVAFGEQHFEENLRFVTESLGVKEVRDYFVKSFYKDHVQRYKKRPIYWLFSSPKGSFNALIYMHRYTPSTVSTVLNEYLREFRAKLSSSLQQQERLAAGSATPRQQAAAQKEADRLRKVLLELEEYEHDVVYPLASRQLALNLDDGVKANYPKFGAALKKIVGLEASDE
ncbi:putative type II restriction enzyme methylase subunit [Alloactinosynnema sp. L-07]|uniref:BREX-1 system adenine-specific DNA-methyltransferase PglX n=1 Tax=Alloactinosynnema sp. L-07 TaxID=1653480 RepID=UPI00065F0958|nr:BREX-1 system adenine-specific DNA-methyltransferase PglX [Alloactinosynnema sp. L-07]CRK59368.1 putative type II restriction enzyme methylase subunit [Alloactinosynnema sp. L-07]